MDVFKLDLDQAQIGSSLVESSSVNTNTIQRNLHTTTGTTGNGNGNSANDHNHLQGVDEEDDEVLPEVSFDANSVFNLHFFDTPEDSSTQGGFSDQGSVESEAEGYLESPPILQTGSLQNHLGQQHQQQQQQTHNLSVECQKFYQSSTTALTLINQRSLGQSVNTNSVLSTSVASGSFPQFGNGGGALYASNNIHNFTQSNSSSSGCSSTSSIASNSSSICGSSSSHNSNHNHNAHNNNGPLSGNNRIVGSSTISSSSSGSAATASSASSTGNSSTAASSTQSTSLGSEHFIGNLNHPSTQSSTVSSSIASLANVKLGMIFHFLIAKFYFI